MAPQEIVFAQFGRVEWMMMLVDAPNRWQRSVSSNMEKLFPHPRSHPSALFPSRGSFGYDRATAIQGAILPIHCYVYLAVPQEAQAATATTGGNNGFDYWGWLGVERVPTFVLRSLRSWYRWSCTAQRNREIRMDSATGCLPCYPQLGLRCLSSTIWLRCLFCPPRKKYRQSANHDRHAHHRPRRRLTYSQSPFSSSIKELHAFLSPPPFPGQSSQNTFLTKARCRCWTSWRLPSNPWSTNEL